MEGKPRLGELLQQARLIDDEQLRQALELQSQSRSHHLGSLLIKMGFITEDDLQRVLAEQLELPLVDIDKEFSVRVNKVLPRNLCRRYAVLPLAFGPNNVLRLAMVDPSDQEALGAVEKYTGRIAVPMLALKSALEKNITARIPWTFRDLFTGRNGIRIATAIAVCAITLVGATTVYLYTDQQREQQGTITRKSGETLYQHHELSLGFLDNGQITIAGRGAHASSQYSITFNDRQGFLLFLDQHHNDFSKTQRTWISWVLTERGAKNKTP